MQEEIIKIVANKGMAFVTVEINSVLSKKATAEISRIVKRELQRN